MEEAPKLKKLEDVVKRLDDIGAKAKVEQDSVLADIAKMGAWDIPVEEAVDKGFTEKFASDLIDGFLARQQYLKPSSPSLKPISTTEVVDAYLIYKSDAGAAEGYLKVRARKLRFFARQYPELLTLPEPLRAYLRQFRTADVPTRQDQWKAVSDLYKFAAREYRIPNPMGEVEKPRFKRKVGKRLSRDQARTYLSALNSDLEWVIVTLYFGLRFRRIEAERLLTDDIKSDYIIVPGKERTEELPLIPLFRELLLKIPNHGPSGQHLPIKAETAAYHVEQAGHRAGFRVSPHMLRNTAAALWSTFGGDWTSNRQLLRHSAKTMTDHYSPLTIDELMVKDERHNPMLNLMRELGLAPGYPNIGSAQRP